MHVIMIYKMVVILTKNVMNNIIIEVMFDKLEIIVLKTECSTTR